MSTPAKADRARLCRFRAVTTPAAASARNTMEKKPMRAGIWVKSFKKEA